MECNRREWYRYLERIDEGQTISASGGTINVNALLVGLHTVTITQFDAAGNMSTKALTFTIRATPSGILAAINAAPASAMTSAEKSTLVSAITAIINAPGNSGQDEDRRPSSAPCSRPQPRR